MDSRGQEYVPDVGVIALINLSNVFSKVAVTWTRQTGTRVDKLAKILYHKTSKGQIYWFVANPYLTRLLHVIIK